MRVATLLAARRLPFALLSAVCAGLLAFGFYLQFVKHLEPCPMCVLQRYFYMLVLLIAGVACAHGARGRGRQVYAALCALAAIAGGGVAARQVWLQHLPPDKVPECGPGLDFMLEIYPWHEALAKAFKGTGDCAVVNWTFLGGSIAEWSLLWFALLTVAALAIMLQGLRAHRA